jgi:hypothetical protein
VQIYNLGLFLRTMVFHDSHLLRHAMPMVKIILPWKSDWWDQFLACFRNGIGGKCLYGKKNELIRFSFFLSLGLSYTKAEEHSRSCRRGGVQSRLT